MTKLPQSRAVLTAIREAFAQCTPIDVEERYNESLDDGYSFSSVGGPFEFMKPSEVLAEMDPVAYRCGLADFADSLTQDGCSSHPDDDDHIVEIDELKGFLDDTLSEWEERIIDMDDDAMGDGERDEIAIDELQSEYDELQEYRDSL